MTDNGIVNFYYTSKLPPNSVAIAQVSSANYTSTDLVNINNLNIVGSGSLGVWKNTTSLTSPADFIAPDFNQSVAIHDSVIYYVGNQLFELTNIVSTDSTPLFYQHSVGVGVENVVILDESENILDVEILIENGLVYHSQPDGLYQLRYVDTDGFIQTEMLLYTPVISSTNYSPTNNQYTYSNSVLTVFNDEIYYIRFTTKNGYQVLPPYVSLSNVPWFVRIRFGVTPTPPEWGTQPFIPNRPYLLGTWVNGQVLSTSVIQFERRQIYYNPNHLPDILVFDSTNKLKYALDGTALNVASTKGYEYPWKKGLINSVDNYSGRVELAVDLDPTDLVFGFYSYQEPDVLFTEVDVNPFTNPLVKNAQVIFYLKTNGQDVTKFLYYQIQDPTGAIIQTNDNNPTYGTNQIFSEVVVGGSVSISNLTVTDIRQRGGGLISSMQNIPQASNFWDLGFWDGKPYPTAGTMIVYLPVSILTTINKSEIQNRITSILPLGVLAVVKFYDELGNEY